MNSIAPAPAPAAVTPDFSGPQYQPYELNQLHDRCDAKCSAQAYYATAHQNGVLTWCSHHFEEKKDALLSDPRVKIVADKSAMLTVRETAVH